jgi:hypothetical protein
MGLQLGDGAAQLMVFAEIPVLLILFGLAGFGIIFGVFTMADLLNIKNYFSRVKFRAEINRRQQKVQS